MTYPDLTLTIEGKQGAGASRLLNEVVLPALKSANLNFDHRTEWDGPPRVHVWFDPRTSPNKPEDKTENRQDWRPAPGDLVMLKSGGDPATVVDLIGCGGEDVAVIYSHGGKFITDEVPRVCLRPYVTSDF